MESRSGTDSTIRAATVSAPCSPCRNWLNSQEPWCLPSSSRSACVIFSHMGVPNSGLKSSGRPITFVGSTSISQSIRFCASHCLSLPFWYSASSRSLPSSYSQVNLAAPAAGTSQVPGSTGDV